jgi:Rrf2 family protein
MLSKKTKYAIKALLNLSIKRGKGPVTIAEIAGEEKIPKKFLEAILLELKNQGMLNSVKGKGGGYYLRMDPEEINMAKIMRLFDGPIALLPCATHMYYEKCKECKDEDTCGIRSVIQEVRDQTVMMLKKSTLAEILLRERRLREQKARMLGGGRQSMPGGRV